MSLFARMIQRLRVWSLTSTSLLAVLLWQTGFALADQRGMADTTSSTLSSDTISAYIADKTLLLAQKQVKLTQFGDKASLPTRSSKTFQYTRYERLALPQSTLTEGVSPASTQMSVSTVTATVEQWGQVVVLTDVAELVIKHPVLQKAVSLLALAAAETMDREVQETLLAGTNTQFINNRATRNSLVAGDVITTAEVREAVANLRNNGAHPYEGDDDLVGLVDPSVEMDITADATFVAAAQYSNVKALFNGEVGKWMGVRWVRDNFLYTFLGAAAASTADVAAGGSINANTTVYVVVTGVDSNTGFERLIAQEGSQATANDGNNTHIVRVTMPATSGYTYNVYAGTASGTTYQVSTGNAASATYDITSVPTSGTQNPVPPATSTTTHIAWVMGKEAFTVVKLDGMSLQTYVTPKGPSDSDPLAQRRKVGWKVMFKAAICNQNFIRRIECVSNY